MKFDRRDFLGLSVAGGAMALAGPLAGPFARSACMTETMSSVAAMLAVSAGCR